MLVISFWSKVTSLVLTALFEGPTHDAITQGAYSVGQPLLYHTLLKLWKSVSFVHSEAVRSHTWVE